MFAALPFPEIDPALFTLPAFSLFGLELGPFSLRWYALAYIAGLVIGWRYVASLLARDRLWPGNVSPMASDKTDDLLLWMTLGVVLGGRMGFVIFYQPELLLQDPFEVLRLWNGGMAFHGGMLGVIIGVMLFARANRVDMIQLGDAVACAAPVGLFFGRIANFINGELWGRPTDMPWGMVFPQVTLFADRFPGLLPGGQNVPRHPSQLYEAALEGLLLFVVLWIAVARFDALKRPGTCIGVFLAGYGLARGFVEFFRQPDPGLGFDFTVLGLAFTRGQTLCIPMIVAGVLFILYARARARAAASA